MHADMYYRKRPTENSLHNDAYACYHAPKGGCAE